MFNINLLALLILPIFCLDYKLLDGGRTQKRPTEWTLGRS